MRYLALALALLGGVIGFMTGLFLNGNAFVVLFHAVGEHPHLWLAVIAWASSLLGVAGGLLLIVRPKWGATLTLAASVAGVFGSMGLWLLAGSFFFAAAMIAFYTDSTDRPVSTN